MSFARGEATASSLKAVDPANRVLTTQVITLESWDDGSLKTADVLFPASIIPVSDLAIALSQMLRFARPQRRRS